MLLVLGRRRRVRRALVRRAEDRRGDGRGVHVPPGRRTTPTTSTTRAQASWSRTRRRSIGCARRRQRAAGCGTCSSSARPRSSVRERRLSRLSPRRRPTSSSRLRPRETTSRSGSSRRGAPGTPKAAVHPQHSPLLSFDWYARGVLDDAGGRRRPPGAEALLRLRARPDGAVSRSASARAGIVFPERTTPERIFELIARHRPSILVQVPTMMAAMVGPSRRGRAGPLLPAPLHLCRRGAPARALRALAGDVRRRGARRDRLLRGLPHLHLQPARPRAPGQRRRARARLPCPRARRRGPSCPTARWGRSGSRATPPRSSTGTSTRRRKQTFSGDLVNTGDLFVRDGDGFFWYRGRGDELIKVGGIWVAPAEVEDCLVSPPRRGRVRGRRLRGGGADADARARGP